MNPLDLVKFVVENPTIDTVNRAIDTLTPSLKKEILPIIEGKSPTKLAELVDDLRFCLNCPNKDFHVVATYALAKLIEKVNPTDLMPLLKPWLKDSNYSVCRAANCALEKLIGKILTPDECAKLMAVLKTWLKDTGDIASHALIKLTEMVDFSDPATLYFSSNSNKPRLIMEPKEEKEEKKGKLWVLDLSKKRKRQTNTGGFFSEKNYPLACTGLREDKVTGPRAADAIASIAKTDPKKALELIQKFEEWTKFHNRHFNMRPLRELEAGLHDGKPAEKGSASLCVR